MKKYFIALVVIIVVTFANASAFSQTELQIRDATIVRLRQLYRGQVTQTQSIDEFYPLECPNNLCWQGQTLSSLNTPGSSNKDLIDWLGNNFDCPRNLTVDTGSNGDIRFRCRRQGINPFDVWCFAYRCEQASPAGCRQVWRLRFKPAKMEDIPPSTALTYKRLVFVVPYLQQSANGHFPPAIKSLFFYIESAKIKHRLKTHFNTKIYQRIPKPFKLDTLSIIKHPINSFLNAPLALLC